METGQLAVEELMLAAAAVTREVSSGCSDWRDPAALIPLGAAACLGLAPRAVADGVEARDLKKI